MVELTEDSLAEIPDNVLTSRKYGRTTYYLLCRKLNVVATSQSYLLEKQGLLALNPVGYFAKPYHQTDILKAMHRQSYGQVTINKQSSLPPQNT